MNDNTGNTSINVDVTLDSTDGRVLFHYRGADETSRNHVDERGNIDLSRPDDLGRGPVDLCFRLDSPQLMLGGAEHSPGFAGTESFWIGEGRHGAPTGPYRARGPLARLGLRRPEFYDCSSANGEARSLRISNRNGDGREYKYTLRVRAAGAGETHWLEDDPKIKNRGTGIF